MRNRPALLYLLVLSRECGFLNLGVPLVETTSWMVHRDHSLIPCVVKASSTGLALTSVHAWVLNPLGVTHGACVGCSLVQPNFPFKLENEISVRQDGQTLEVRKLINGYFWF